MFRTISGFYEKVLHELCLQIWTFYTASILPRVKVEIIFYNILYTACFRVFHKCHEIERRGKGPTKMMIWGYIFWRYSWVYKRKVGVKKILRLEWRNLWMTLPLNEECSACKKNKMSTPFKFFGEIKIFHTFIFFVMTERKDLHGRKRWNVPKLFNQTWPNYKNDWWRH